MSEVKNWQIFFTAVISAFLSYICTLLIPIMVLVIMMIIDYITGMGAAYTSKKLSSKIGVKGIAKKVGYMALIAVAMGVDYIIFSGFSAAHINITYNMFFGFLVVIWLIINEMISILENLKKLDVPIPNFLKKIINRLKTTVETVDESEDKKND